MKVGSSSALIWLFSIGRHPNAPARLRRRTQLFSLCYYQPIILSPDPNSTTVESGSSPPSARITSPLAKSSGVTSLLHFPLEGSTEGGTNDSAAASHQVFVGTKRGDVAILQFDVGSQDDPHIEHIATLPSASAALQLPIFSLAVEEEEETRARALYVGGGDRYISVWRKHHQNDSWVGPTQRLGPHTGWVKSIAQFRGDQLRQRRHLYSIGCNRIETWECVNAPPYDENLDGALHEDTRWAMYGVDTVPFVQAMTSQNGWA